ncbi:glutamine--fructose-6-phosphate transaminase (isomerizing) [Candidatus Saccharibacteria bacterium]|nr:glutamine--fructose-6-phosphate transaminase (isomerizing) [Candidatus Saccharibacteria bacterium]
MCGIIGYIGTKRARDILLTGLKRMEYRGYDSAGIATIEEDKVVSTRSVGNVSGLVEILKSKTHKGMAGIGHTRWATHGAPSEANAHPHTSGKVTLVHNGIFENYQEYKTALEQAGRKFHSQTDSEVLAALIDFEYENEINPRIAITNALKKVRGTFGLAILFEDQPDMIAVARRSSPLLIAKNGSAVFIASDQYALAGHASNATVLQDDEIAICRADNFEVFSMNDYPVGKEILKITASEESIGKDGYEHFMQKEIFEQPQSIQRTLSGRINKPLGTSQLGGINLTPKQLRGVKSMIFVGCGTAYYAGLLAKYLLEPIVKIPISVEVASEFRYRSVALNGNELSVVISQSGETADTIACVEELQLKGIPVLGVVNVVGSSIARLVDGGIYLHAGPEISVASTKAFSSQVTALLLLGIYLARQRDLNLGDGQELLEQLEALPKIIEEVLKIEKEIKVAARKFAKLPHLMALGRDLLYPVSLEIVLKIKELTYIPASAYPAGEMKHGPNALLSPEMGVIYLHGEGPLSEKSVSNLAEVRARKAQLLIFTDTEIDASKDEIVIKLPKSSHFAQGIIFTVAGQLLAYHMAIALDRNVDKPRNLAKSVTVE